MKVRHAVKAAQAQGRDTREGGSHLVLYPPGGGRPITIPVNHNTGDGKLPTMIERQLRKAGLS